MGLSWSPVLTQCGANQTTGIAVWVGQGNPVPGLVTATFGTAPASAAIVVSRYAGVDLVLPVAASASANTAGISGACTGGTDSAGYSFSFGNSRETSVVVTAVATGAGVLTPGRIGHNAVRPKPGRAVPSAASPSWSTPRARSAACPWMAPSTCGWTGLS